MLTNTAAATFSDDWDAEEPTVIDRDLPQGRIRCEFLIATPGAWASVDDAALVQALRTDPKATHNDLAAVTF